MKAKVAPPPGTRQHYQQAMERGLSRLLNLWDRLSKPERGRWLQHYRATVEEALAAYPELGVRAFDVDADGKPHPWRASGVPIGTNRQAEDNDGES